MKSEMKVASAPKHMGYRGKPVRRAEAHCASNGGYVVRLHHEVPGEYNEPQEHALGEDEGHKVLKLIGKHLGIKEAKEEAQEEKEEAGEGEE